MHFIPTLLALTGLFALITADSNTATLHVFKGRQNSVVVVSRGKLPEVGSTFTAADPSVLGGAPEFMSFSLTGSSVSTTGGTYPEDAELHKMPSSDITIDWAACADLDINLTYENKSNAKLPLFGVMNDAESNFYFMFPKEMEPGTSIIGRATILARDQTAFEELFNMIDPYTTCSMEWMNEDGEAQRLEVILGKDLTIVYIIVGAAVGVLAVIGLVAFLCLGRRDSK